MFNKTPYTEFKHDKPHKRSCSICKIIKPFSDFNKTKSGYLGFESLCKSCKSKKHKLWKIKNNITTKPREPKTIKNKNGKVTHRICNKCKQLKKLANFNKTKNRYLGRESMCRTCKKETTLKRKYNISSAQKEKIWLNQNKMCAGCSKQFSANNLAVDHCHTTGMVRGLLCVNCNIGLGLFGDGNENTVPSLSQAIKYLKHPPNFNDLIKPNQLKTKKRINKLKKENCRFSSNGILVKKPCPRCGKTKYVECFNKHKSGFFGYRSRCRECEKEANLEKTYGISFKQKTILFQNQERKCGICNVKFTIDELWIDHCHNSKNIRGLLCNSCNTGLGFLGDGSKKTFITINNLISYVQNKIIK